MSGRACWELSSATEPGVGTLLSMLGAVWWDNLKQKQKLFSAASFLKKILIYKKKLSPSCD